MMNILNIVIYSFENIYKYFSSGYRFYKMGFELFIEIDIHIYIYIDILLESSFHADYKYIKKFYS